jgi:hypothetical protein
MLALPAASPAGPAKPSRPPRRGPTRLGDSTGGFTLRIPASTGEPSGGGFTVRVRDAPPSGQMGTDDLLGSIGRTPGSTHDTSGLTWPGEGPALAKRLCLG